MTDRPPAADPPRSARWLGRLLGHGSAGEHAAVAAALGALGAELGRSPAGAVTALLPLAVREAVPAVLLDVARDAGVERDANARQLRLELSGRAMIQRQHARRALELIHGAGVPAVPLKGFALTGRVYPADGQRTVGDLDVVVPHPPTRAVAVLRAAGWTRSSADPAYVAHTEGPTGIHAVLQSPGRLPLTIELHHRLYDDLSDTAADWLLAGATPGLCPATGAPVRNAPLAVQFVLVSHHLLLNDRRPLRWWLDIDRLVHAGLDPAAVATAATALADPLSPALALAGAAQQIGTRVPEPLWSALCDRLRPRERTELQRCLDHQEGVACAMDKIPAVRALSLERGTGRLHRLSPWRLLFPHPGEVSQILNVDSRRPGFWHTRLAFAWRRIRMVASRLR